MDSYDFVIVGGVRGLTIAREIGQARTLTPWRAAEALPGPAPAPTGTRIVSVSSSAHRLSPIVFDDINFERRPYDPWLSYGQSKTANVLFAVEAARRWAPDGITANALMPGGIRTGLQRYQQENITPEIQAIFDSYPWRTVEQGAATSVLLAASPLVEGVTGRYFEDCDEAGVTTDPDAENGVRPHALDPEDAARLRAGTVSAPHVKEIIMSRTWLITGSSQGLGRRIAEVALQRGDRVVAASRRPELLDDLARTHGERLLPAALDVTDSEAARAVVRQAVERFGSLDVVVNNAGYATSASIEEFPDEEFRTQVEANLFGAVNVTKAVLPMLREQRSGHFIQISSIGGRVGGTPGLGAYQTAKFGLEGFSEVLANEVAPLGIKVTIVEPGGIRTGWTSGAASPSAPVGADYEATVGEWLRMFTRYSGEEPGDPVRMATAIADVVDAEAPPRRLLLGSDALRIALESAAERTAEAEKWAGVSRSTDFDAP